MRSALKTLRHVKVLIDRPMAVGILVILIVGTVCLLVPLPV
jgi:hypothetical protein